MNWRKWGRGLEEAPGGDGDLLESAPRDIFYAWAIGAVGAVALAAYGISCIRTQSATFVGGTDLDLALGGGPEMPCRGLAAVALGVLCVASAAFLHFHFFWSWRERFLGCAQIGKVLSAVAATGSLFYFIVRVVFYD